MSLSRLILPTENEAAADWITTKDGSAKKRLRPTICLKGPASLATTDTVVYSKSPSALMVVGAGAECDFVISRLHIFSEWKRCQRIDSTTP
jgi:hypothetical protein